MKIKRIATVAVAATIALGLAACATPAKSGDSGGGKELYIALVSKGFAHQFWRAVNAGADQAAKEFKVKVTFEGPESDSAREEQISMLQAALDRHPDAIGFAALDSKTAEPLMQQAKAAGIPVIAFDSGVDSIVPVTTTTTDNIAAAQEAAKHFAAALPQGGEIGIINFDKTSATGIAREKGFKDWMAANAPKITIVDTQYTTGDHQKSNDAAQAMINGHPNLKGIFGTNEGTAIGVVQAVKELKRTDLVLVGFDAGKEQLDAIRDKTLLGSITQNPVGIGYETVKAAVAAIKGEKPPKTIDTGFYWYDSTNIDDPKIASVLYN